MRADPGAPDKVQDFKSCDSCQFRLTSVGAGRMARRLRVFAPGILNHVIVRATSDSCFDADDVAERIQG
jgi:hypothetical protein